MRTRSPRALDQPDALQPALDAPFVIVQIVEAAEKEQIFAGGQVLVEQRLVADHADLRADGGGFARQFPAADA